jgi:hypothetical protein
MFEQEPLAAKRERIGILPLEPHFFDLFSLCYKEREIQNGFFGDNLLE